MKYENGRDLLPPELLRQVQKYAAGRLIYIPSMGKTSWGESSGYRRYLWERNQEIRMRLRQGERPDALAEAYCLSEDSIRKIACKKEGPVLDYECTLSSAKAFAAAGRLEDWVHAYLLSDADNPAFSHGLKLFDRFFLGPVKMPLRLFKRCCGPEEGMKWQVHPVYFENKVNRLMEAARQEPDMPPLIINYRFSETDGTPEFELNDGNGRFEAYTRLGRTHADVIFWITEEMELADFRSRYGWLLGAELPQN